MSGTVVRAYAQDDRPLRGCTCGVTTDLPMHPTVTPTYSAGSRSNSGGLVVPRL